MGQIINRNGKDYVFPDSYTPEQIEAEINKSNNVTNVNSQKQIRKYPKKKTTKGVL